MVSWLTVLMALLFYSHPATDTVAFSLEEASNGLPCLRGKQDKSDFPCVTAGNRLYAIGSQGGGFPEIGFHVKDEMGGIWQHPIKLLDGFEMKLTDLGNGQEQTLQRCDTFTTYPFLTRYTYLPKAIGIQVNRTQFVPDDLPVLVVEYSFRNTGREDKKIRAALHAAADLRPVWLGEESGMTDGTDLLFKEDKANNTVIFKDTGQLWFAGISSGSTPMQPANTGKSAFKGKGLTGVLNTTLTIPAGKTILLHYYITGSTKSMPEVQQHISRAVRDLPSLFRQKLERYRKLENNAVLDIPDRQLLLAYQWGKYSTDWLVRDVPGLGRGLGAGLPDYPWFFSNDQAYTFQGLTGLITPELFYDSWRLLKRLSDSTNNSSGRIIHEASTNGTVYDKGRMEESQLHIITAWDIFKWTGNRDFLRENYAYGKKVWNWLQQHDRDHDLYIEGYGGVEIEGLNDEMLDVAVYTQQFCSVMSEMAAVLNEQTDAADYRAKADTLKARINRDWWIAPEHRYADFIADKTKALEIIDSALKKRVRPDRNKWAAANLRALRSQIAEGRYKEQGYNVYYNNTGLLPVKEGIADTAKALQLLRHIGFFTNRYGLYIAGIERPDNLRIDEGSFLSKRSNADFSYSGAIMPVATGSLAIAACRYGSPDTALKYSIPFSTPSAMPARALLMKYHLTMACLYRHGTQPASTFHLFIIFLV